MLFIPLYAWGVAPNILTVSNSWRLCAEEQVTVAVPELCVNELIPPVTPPEVAAWEIVIVPSSWSPTTSIESIFVLSGIPVPIIVEPTTKFFVVIFVIVVDPTVTFPDIVNCLASVSPVVVIFVMVTELLARVAVTVRSVVSPSSGSTAPPIQETIAEAPDPSVLALSKNKGSPTWYPVPGLSIITWSISPEPTSTILIKAFWPVVLDIATVSVVV